MTAPTHSVIGPRPTYPISDEQIAAIVALESRVAVIGGPGTAKSALLCGHIRHLTLPRMDDPPITTPDRIICIAFTRRAYEEIILRLHNADPTAEWARPSHASHRRPVIGTHHGFLLWLINRYKAEAGFDAEIPWLQYLNDRKKETLQTNCRQEATRELNEKTSLPSTSEAIAERAEALFRQEIHKQGLVDYPTLVASVHRILQNTKCRQDLEAGNYYLLIDEAQDLGPEESEIYELLPARQKYIVGDSAQAIYPYQDQGKSLLTHFLNNPATRRIQLTRNFRSLQPICTASWQLIQHHEPPLNVPLLKSVQEPVNPNAPIVLAWRCIDEQDQLALLARLVQHYSETLPRRHLYNQVAILYKFPAHANLIAAVLNSHNIPYRQLSAETTFSGEQFQETNAVNVARITQIKGLQYPNVIVPFCTSNYWPGDYNPQLARRQLYTTMNRAEHTAHFLWHELTEDDDGQPLAKPIRMSPFLAEMDRPQRVVVHNETREEIANPED